MKATTKCLEATAAVIDENGWLHTGSLARMDEERILQDNRPDQRIMIIRGGENIYPKEIEDFIYTHPSVKDVR